MSTWESVCRKRFTAEGATTPESLRHRDQVDAERWKERACPPPTGKAISMAKLSGTKDSGGHRVNRITNDLYPTLTHHA